MCLIIASPLGTVPPVGVLTYAYLQNPHGWGIAYFDGATVHVDKGMHRPAFLRAMERVNGLPYIAHLRYATHGAKNRANTHPFRIMDGLWMAHNGIIKIDCHDATRSDTWHFAQLIGSILESTPEWYGTEGFDSEVSAFIGRSNKLTFMDASGDIKIIHEKEGLWIDEMWFSNDYSLPQRYGWGAEFDLQPTQFQDRPKLLTEIDWMDTDDSETIRWDTTYADTREHRKPLSMRDFYLHG